MYAADPPTLGTIVVCGSTMRADVEPALPLAEFPTFEFVLVDPHGVHVPIDVTPRTAGGDVFLGANLRTNPARTITEGFFLELLRANTILDVKPVPVSSSSVKFRRERPGEITATFPCSVDPLSVKVAVGDREVPATVDQQASSKRVMTLRLTTPLEHEDSVEITAKSLDGGDLVSVKGDVDFEAPEDIESAVIYVGGKVELDEGSKPNVLVDLKYDGALHPIGHSISWFHGPSLLVDAATQDDDGESSATAGWRFRHLRYFVTRGKDAAPGTADDRFVLTRLDVTPEIELGDGLDSRNLIADLDYEWQFAGAKWDFRPAVGLESGTNLALKTKLESFSDYRIVRPTVDLYLARDFEGIAGTKAIKFSISVQSRYLLEREPDVEPLPRAQQTDDEKTFTRFFEDGFKMYGKASLTFGLTENFSIALEYERGERPPLYGDNNKGGISIVFSR
jgi:hypothetical protein